MLPGRVNSGGFYEDRYSATVAGAGAVLASTSSWVAAKAEGGAHGRFADTPELRTVSASSTLVEPDMSQVAPAKRVLQVSAHSLLFSACALTDARATALSQPPPPKVYTSDDALRRKLSASVRQCCSNGAAGVGVASLFSRLTTALGYGDADTPAAPGSTARPLRRSMSSRIAVEQQQGRVSEVEDDAED